MINIIVIRDLQIKTTIRCHCTLLECLKSQLLITPHAGKDVKQQELSLTADENANGTARDFLVAWWLRICLPMRGVQVGS